ncbi:Rap1a/Tai family immunity protein [Novosphingobium sp. BL-8H]|uniref:Rap1a/Tai family immunity protein n=1 Tax=Novosphingobium sp. BL-8H TaxID=3127640 RepID=UPI003757A7B6
MIRAVALLVALGLFLGGADEGHWQPQARAATPVSASSPAAMKADDAAAIGFLTAGQLAQQCREGTAFSVTYCLAFLAGVHDSMRAYEQWLDQREFCAPNTVKQRDLSNAFLAFVTAHPEYRDGLASSVAVVALKEAWPCTSPGR